MVAPNGARKTKADHPQLPLSIEEIVETAIACQKAGADGLHAHVRDASGKHVLDAGQYLELLDECKLQLPGFYVQITTEAAGVFSQAQQDRVVSAVEPEAVSVALNEMALGEDERLARNFYHRADETGTELQHILYTGDEMDQLLQCRKRGIIPAGKLNMLFVLGRYAVDQQSAPEDIWPFLSALHRNFGNQEVTDRQEVADRQEMVDWALCAFGRDETECLVQAAKSGGKIRVGFENSTWNRDGSIALDNAERVKEIAGLI